MNSSIQKAINIWPIAWLKTKKLNSLVSTSLRRHTLHVSVRYVYFVWNYDFKEVLLRRHSLAETFREVTVLSSWFSAMQVKVTFSSGAITILLENFPLTYLVSSVWTGKKQRLVSLKNAKNNTCITYIIHWKFPEGNNSQLIFHFFQTTAIKIMHYFIKRLYEYFQENTLAKISSSSYTFYSVHCKTTDKESFQES